MEKKHKKEMKKHMGYKNGGKITENSKGNMRPYSNKVRAPKRYAKAKKK